MPALAALLGGSLGLCVQFYSNGVRKLPLMRHPWEHLLAIGIGSAFGNGLVNWEERVRVDLDKSIEEARTANKKRFIDDFSIEKFNLNHWCAPKIKVEEILPAELEEMEWCLEFLHDGDGNLTFHLLKTEVAGEDLEVGHVGPTVSININKKFGCVDIIVGDTARGHWQRYRLEAFAYGRCLNMAVALGSDPNSIAYGLFSRKYKFHCIEPLTA